MTTDSFDIDVDKIRDYLVTRIPELAGEPIELSRHSGGHSCETWHLFVGNRRWILRRPPRAHVQRGASNMGREFRVMTALQDTPVPVPRTILLCEDTGVIGAQFLVMEEVGGVVLRNSFPEGFDNRLERRVAIGQAVVDTLASLHKVDWQIVGLHGHGNPDGFLRRNFRLMLEQWERVRQREIPAIDQLSSYLKSHVPNPWPATIVHGDYKLDNLIWKQDTMVSVAAVLDWEVSTLADPRVDLGWLRGFWTDEADSRGVSVLGGGVLTAGGFPSRDEIVARYGERLGRRVDELEWFEAFAMWKIAIIMEASYMRHLRGASNDPFFASLDIIVPLLAEAGLAALAEAGRI